MSEEESRRADQFTNIISIVSVAAVATNFEVVKQLNLGSYFLYRNFGSYLLNYHSDMSHACGGGHCNGDHTHMDDSPEMGVEYSLYTR